MGRRDRHDDRDFAGATIIESHTNRIVASGITAIPDAVYFSNLLDADTWDMLNGQIRIGGGDGDPIVALKSWLDTGIVVFKRNSVYLIDANPISASPTSRSSGFTEP